jgi:nitroreductase
MDNSIFFKRQSRRSYLDKPIPDDVMQRLYEKVRWSPSCRNNQPWRMIFVTDSEQHRKFMECLPDGNQWADKAPVLVAVVARESDDDVRNDDPVKYYQFDCGLAVMSLLLAATDEGLMGHPMAGYDAAKLHEALDIPDEYHVMCIVSLGYQGPPELLTGGWLKGETAVRTRKELNEIICQDKFSF